MPRSGEQTRQRIIDAAERLFSEKGVAGVSMRELNLAAGQRNNSALQYHFADLDGVLRAMADKHMPAIDARQQELYDELTADASIDELDRFVQVSIRPMAEHLDRGPSERAWIIVVSELLAHPRLDGEAMSSHATVAVTAAGLPIYERLERESDSQLALHRLRTVAESALHALADRARHEAATDRARDLLPRDVFIEDLLAVVTGALTAPLPQRPRPGVRRPGG